MRQCCCWKAVSGSALAPVLQCSVLGMSPAAGEPQNHRCHLLMAAELSSGESPKKSHRAFVSSQPASHLPEHLGLCLSPFTSAHLLSHSCTASPGVR